jgi:putative ABC transport system permease protein
VILRNLLRRKFRTSLALVGIAISVGATVTLLGLSQGLVAQITSVVSGPAAELTVMQRIPEGLTFGYVGSVPYALAERIRAVPGVAAVSAMTITPVAIRRDLIFLIYGIDPAGAEPGRHRLLSGRRLKPDDGPVMLLGRRAAAGLDKSVGDSLTVSGQQMRIIGIYETGVGLEDGGGMVSLEAARTLFGFGERVSLFRVRMSDARHLDTIRPEIESAVPDVTVLTPDEFARDRLHLEAAIHGAWAISIVALLLGLLGVANTMATSVLERTREIGILRAVGWRRSRILVLVLGEAALLSVLGGVFGIALGAGVMRFLSDTYETLPVPDSVPPDLLAAAIALAVAVGLAGGLGPALRAARIDPVQALRHE